MKTQEYNEGVSFRIPTMGFKALCSVVESVPGVVFTKRRKFFWSGEDVGAEFTFRGHAWDGVLWIIAKDAQKHLDEMKILRDAVEGATSDCGFFGRLWHRLIIETFT